MHSVQSLGRGIADDAALLDRLSDAVLPMEAATEAEATRAAAELGSLECLESGTTTVVDHLSVNHAAEAFEAAVETGIRARLGKVLMDRDSPEGLQEDTDAALAERAVRQAKRVVEAARIDTGEPQLVGVASALRGGRPQNGLNRH